MFLFIKDSIRNDSRDINLKQEMKTAHANKTLKKN